MITREELKAEIRKLSDEELKVFISEIKRDRIKEYLELMPYVHDLFVKLYSKSIIIDGLTVTKTSDINKIVDQMEDKQLDHALYQCKSTYEKRGNKLQKYGI